MEHAGSHRILAWSELMPLRPRCHQVRSSESHFVRCIKPNAKTVPGEWDESLVSRQLAYSGDTRLLEVSPQPSILF